MPARVLFDTDVLIDASRGVPDAVTALRDAAQKYEVAISAITRMELIVGCRDTRELRATEAFVKRFTVLPVDEPASNEAVELLVSISAQPRAADSGCADRGNRDQGEAPVRLQEPEGLQVYSDARPRPLSAHLLNSVNARNVERLKELRRERLYAAYEEAVNAPDYAAEMAEIDAEFDVAVGDGLEDE